jgi:glutathione S-transferase
MTDHAFTPVLYLQQNCPFCLKVRIAVLETGQADAVDLRVFVPGTPEEAAIRAELDGKLAKITFPAALFGPGEYVADSDAIVAALAERAGRRPADMPVYTAYLDAAFQPMMGLFQENKALKAAATPAGAKGFPAA